MRVERIKSEEHELSIRFYYEYEKVKICVSSHDSRVTTGLHTAYGTFLMSLLDGKRVSINVIGDGKTRDVIMKVKLDDEWYELAEEAMRYEDLRWCHRMWSVLREILSKHGPKETLTVLKMLGSIDGRQRKRVYALLRKGLDHALPKLVELMITK